MAYPSSLGDGILGKRPANPAKKSVLGANRKADGTSEHRKVFPDSILELVFAAHKNSKEARMKKSVLNNWTFIISSDSDNR